MERNCLGWNFLPGRTPEFSSGIKIDESGYFICSNWWENTDTQAVMCIGAIEGREFTSEDIIRKQSERAGCGTAGRDSN